MPSTGHLPLIRRAAQPRTGRTLLTLHRLCGALLLVVLIAQPGHRAAASLAPADSLAVSITGVPDSALEFSPVTFFVQYNTAGRDLCLNVSVVGDPNNESGRNFSTWVNGAGELAYHARIPGARKASRYYMSAYLTSDGSWANREIFTSTNAHRILTTPLSVQWAFTVPQSAAADSQFVTSVAYTVTPRHPMSIPFLAVDLVAPDDCVVARSIEWSVPDSARFTQRWTIPPGAGAGVSALRIRARLEDEEYSATAPPVASGEGGTFPISGSATPVYGRVAFRADTLLIDGAPAFMQGVDVFAFWNTWSDSTIRREIGRMHAAGLNYARVFLDWSRFEPQENVYSDAYRHSASVLLRAADSLGVWLELVPAGNWGGWIYDMYKDHWWTDSVSRGANTAYFETFGRWLDSLGARSVLYVSVMQEGSWYYDWFDPFTSGSYPGPACLAQADADWRAWLAGRGQAYAAFDSCDMELYSRWASERFTDLLQLRIAAFRRGSRGRYAVGAAGTGGGAQYSRRIYAKHPSMYALPELWAHAVDVVEMHTYTPVSGDGYWSGSTGLRTLKEWMAPFRMPLNVGEINWTYAGSSIDMGVDSCWRKLREDLELVRANGYIGYGIWAWMDYDARKLGLNDQQFRARPVLDSLAAWIRAQHSTAVTPPAQARDFTLEQNFPNPFTDATSFLFTLRAPADVRLDVYSALGQRVATVASAHLAPGRYAVPWNATALPAGVYSCVLRCGASTASRSMVKY